MVLVNLYSWTLSISVRRFVGRSISPNQVLTFDRNSNIFSSEKTIPFLVRKKILIIVDSEHVFDTSEHSDFRVLKANQSFAMADQDSAKEGAWKIESVSVNGTEGQDSLLSQNEREVFSNEIDGRTSFELKVSVAG